MATNIQLAGTTFANPIERPLPMISGMLVWSYFTTSASASPNVGSMGAYANVGPGPTYNPGYARFISGQAALQVLISPRPAAGTVLVVTRYVGGTGGVSAVVAIQGPIQVALGNISGTNPPNTAYCVGAAGAGQATISNLVGATNWHFYAGQSGGNAVSQIWNETDGTSAAGTGTGSLSGAPPTMIIGSNSATPTANDRSLDIAFFAMYDSLLSKAQIDQIYYNVKDHLAHYATPIVI
jgi:hypothetical protein